MVTIIMVFPHTGRLLRYFPVFDNRTAFTGAPSASLNTSICEALDFELHWLDVLLVRLCNSRDLHAQIQHLRNMDVDAQEQLRGTVFEHNMLVALLRICHTTKCTDCDQLGGDGCRLVSQSTHGEMCFLAEAELILRYYFE